MKKARKQEAKARVKQITRRTPGENILEVFF
jgi:hypothetical protein